MSGEAEKGDFWKNPWGILPSSCMYYLTRKESRHRSAEQRAEKQALLGYSRSLERENEAGKMKVGEAIVWKLSATLQLFMIVFLLFNCL
jgi:hypothetical protein